MIKNKNELYKYLEQDKKALGIKHKHPKWIGDYIWKYQKLYRNYEYLRNRKRNVFLLPLVFLTKIRFDKASIKYGFSIPINVFGPGLSIAHYGTIVVNGNAEIGENCRIQENVTIGATNGSDKAPIIGNNVFIGSGAKIIGDIIIADDVAIGAGSVVIQSIEESGVTVAGVPARIISRNNSHKNLNTELLNGV